MYEMTLDGEIFFYPANEKYTLISAVLYESLNDAGYIEALVPISNPLYDRIAPRKSKIELFKDGERIFSGIVTEVKLTFNMQKSIYIVGELSYLNDTVQVQQSYPGYNKAQLLSVLLANHNAQSPIKFLPGQVGVSGAPTTLIDYGYTLEVIKSCICGSDGYIKLRRTQNGTYVDILPIESYGKQSAQAIRFGSNLLDYAEETDASELATAIIPLGDRLETAEIEGLDSYLTIASVNGGNNTIVSQSAVNNFGWICRVVNFNNVTEPEELLRLGKAYLTSSQFAKLTLELSAVDLSALDSTADDYDLGDYIRCIAEPFDMDAWLPVRKKTTDLLDLTRNKIVLGATRASSLTASVSSSVSNIKAQMPQQNTLLASARQNASKLINDATTGYVTIRPNELTISDIEDLEQALRIWRWNMGGLGYSKDGGQTYGTAITMDGSIVADYITAGEMSADRVRGGQFVVGGSGTGKDGEIIGYTSNNAEVFRLNKNGGTFKGDISAATLGGGAGQTLQTAINTANEAIRTAQSAASTAQSTANDAKGAASNAASAAASAKSAADSASQSAAYAQSLANNAQSTANSAYFIANGISSGSGGVGILGRRCYWVNKPSLGGYVLMARDE